MSLLSNFKPKESGLSKWVREVRRVLLASEGGLSWADNIGPVLAFKETGANLNTADEVQEIPLDLPKPPAAVFVLKAQIAEGADGCFSGNTIAWTWANGKLRVVQITGLDTSFSYDVTLGVMTE